MSNFKTQTLRDERWIKHQSKNMHCCITGQPHPDASHIRHGLGGGMGLKPADNRTLPLSHALHAQSHTVGETAFWQMYLSRSPEFLMFCLTAGAEKLHRMYKNNELPENFFIR